ncbi:tetratricopeptide repeat protein [Blastomonas sp.]|uniref:tetratricopeptide repeat protein n=1 Tax=Blastomonas sp. TaxID=1909299 RepID=UPI00391A170B
MLIRSVAFASFVGSFGVALATPAALAFSGDTITAVANEPAAVGDDVGAAARRWLKGEAGGRADLETLAADGRSDAQEMLGELLGPFGPAELRDDVAACGWFAKASTSRSDALHNLAVCAENGVIGSPDFARAAALYLQAAQQGYPKSMCAARNLYLDGRGVPKDEAMGVALCRQGAELGNPDAQTDLGNLYLKGSGVARDIVQARHWYERAAEQGQANAQFVLGQIYWKGDGIAQSQVRATELWKAAYRGGRVDAAPLLAKSLFASWMASHAKGDVAGLDEAIQYQEAAVRLASGGEKSEEQELLQLMQEARAVAKKED